MNTNFPEAIPFVAKALIDQMNGGDDLSILYCMDDYRKVESFMPWTNRGKWFQRSKYLN